MVSGRLQRVARPIEVMPYFLFALFCWALSFSLLTWLPMPPRMDPRPPVRPAITQLPQ